MQRFFRFLFSFEGRLSRRQFWLSYAGPMILVWAGVYAWQIQTQLPATAALNTLYWLILFLVPWTIPALAIHTRRMHDIGLSGKWAAVLWATICPGSLLIFFVFRDIVLGLHEGGYAPSVFSNLEHGVILALIILVVAAAVALVGLTYLVPGQKRQNRYGAPN